MANNMPAARGLEKQRSTAAKLFAAVEPLLRPLASLRLTVVLLGLAIFIVFVGTLAQARLDMWQVMDVYFRSGIAWIDPDVFFPPAWFPNHVDYSEGLAIPFPGGFSIGVAMALNLLAAHLVRFRITGTGRALVAGWGIMLCGALVTWLVIASGHNEQGLQGEPFFSWHQMWVAIQIALSAATAVNTVALLTVRRAGRLERWLLAGSAVVFAAISGWTLLGGEQARLPDAALRVLWQLCQGGLAGLVLLAGCSLVFGRKAGIVLIHLGVGMLMFSELYVSLGAKEEHMLIEKGRTLDFASESRFLELAFVDPSDAETDAVTVVPVSLLREGELFEHSELPFVIKLLKFYRNSGPPAENAPAENLATHGMGKQFVLVNKRPVSGADTGSKSNIASAYVEFLTQDGKSLGTWLLTQYNTREVNLNDVPERIAGEGRTFEVYLRHKRNYKPYRMHVAEVRGDNYLGTRKARNYSSDVELHDLERQVVHKAHIRMNEPLRYAGETFYQSGFNEVGSRKFTTLQVVTNQGWMMPYVGCGMVAVGMAGHFLLLLAGFLTQRREASLAIPLGWADRLVPAVVVAVCLAYLGSKGMPRRANPETLDLVRCGQLPVAHKGRVKPLDSLARNSLRTLSKREEFTDTAQRKQPAIRWLLDLAVDEATAAEHPVLRIENDELLKKLNLEKRPGLRYSVREVEAELETLREEFAEIREVQAKIEQHEQARQNLDQKAAAAAVPRLSVYQQKVLELLRHLELINQLRETLFVPPEQISQYKEMEDLVFRTAFYAGKGDEQEPPLVAPTGNAEKPWNTLVVAAGQARLQQLARQHQLATPAQFVEHVLAARKLAEQSPDFMRQRMLSAVETILSQQNDRLKGSELRAAAQTKLAEMPEGMQRLLLQAIEQDVAGEREAARGSLEKGLGMALGTLRLNGEPAPSAAALLEIFHAYRAGNAARFQQALEAYEQMLAAAPPEHWSARATHLESYFNGCSPFYYCAVLYVIAFVLGVASWLGWPGPLGRSAFALVAATFLVHTVALAARVYISGRPPVTNLYSSAVFIGWAAVLLGLALDWFNPLRIGAVVSAAAGFVTLLVAYFLSLDGDTIEVLQAVLDTQIWLATHVVTISLGYSTTYLAGLLSLVYLGLGVFTPRLTRELSQRLARMIYGVVCFAIFFSLVGTVLGGLWADDSWGRFWGWDPKENGALIIVLWNALVLHARWCGMVRARGLAVLGVGGNIITSWSWFGVNQLGVGLHSYGFNDKLMMALVGVAISQLVVMGIGLLPRHLWMSGDLQPEGNPDNPDVATILAAARQ